MNEWSGYVRNFISNHNCGLIKKIQNFQLLISRPKCSQEAIFKQIDIAESCHLKMECYCIFSAYEYDWPYFSVNKYSLHTIQKALVMHETARA